MNVNWRWLSNTYSDILMALVPIVVVFLAIFRQPKDPILLIVCLTACAAYWLTRKWRLT